MILLPLVLAMLATLVAGFLAWWEYRRTEELFTPWMLFLIYAVLDIFLPASIFLIGEPPSLTDWIVPLRKEDIATSTLVYVVSLAFFAAGYFFASRRDTEEGGSNAWRALGDLRPRLGYLYVGLVISAGWYLFYQFTLVADAGSIDVYLSDKFRQRFRPDIFASRNLFDFVFNQFAPSMLPIFLVLVGILFFFRYKYDKPMLWGWALPAVAWLLTLTTFYRGYQLNYFLSLAFIEACRLRVARLHPEAHLQRSGRPATRVLMAPRTKVLAAVAVLLFVFYGAYRQYHSSFQYGRPVSMVGALTSQGGELVRGWGVVGLTSIVHAYPDGGSRLGGTSLITSLFMPVPRPLWPGKPERYGAEEVTRQMGWPITTQSAITMPGELYANFGLLGVPVVMAFGLLFRAVYRRRLHPKLFFAYAFFVPHGVLLTHWMSATGLMTTVTLYSLSVGAVFLVLRRNDSHAPAHTDVGDHRGHLAPVALSAQGARRGSARAGAGPLPARFSRAR